MVNPLFFYLYCMVCGIMATYFEIREVDIMSVIMAYKTEDKIYLGADNRTVTIDDDVSSDDVNKIITINSEVAVAFAGCYKSQMLFNMLMKSLKDNTKMLIKDFLERDDCAEYKDYEVFVSEQYKTMSCRTMDMEPDYTGDNISFLQNVKKNENIRKFCRMIDNLYTNEVNMFEIFEMYRSVYKCVWCRGNKHHIKELIIYDAVISFFKYPEVKRKQVKFFDFLLVDIMKKYVMGHKKLDVTEMFPHEDLLPCPFCGKSPHIYMKVFWFDLIVTIECDECVHVMSKHVIESSGLNQDDRLYINSFKEVINALVEKWNHRIKDDMWLDDETLPDELPECEPDMPSKITYANGLKRCPFCGNKAGFIKRNSSKGRDGKRDPEGIKKIKVICSKGCFSASHFGTPEKTPDKDTIGYMAYRWNQRKDCV